jgi:hypothetical protein
MQGIKRMQGVPAHLEYLRSDDQSGRHTCRGCFYYKEKKCHSLKSSYYGLEHCSARYCKAYKRKYNSNCEDLIPCKRNKDVNKKSKAIHKRQQGKVYYGDCVVIIDVTDENETYKIGPIKENTEDMVAAKLRDLFLYKKIGDIVAYRERKYKIEEIIVMNKE